MENRYIFDVDGVLCNPGERIDPEFEGLIPEYSIFVSGSSVMKMREQLRGYSGIFYGCCGNERWITGSNEIYRYEDSPPMEVVGEIQGLIDDSNYYGRRTGNHIEYRWGMLNFSVVGRNANPSQRAEYYKWDCIHGERERMVKYLRETFPHLLFQIGGKISVDVMKYDKSQILYMDCAEDYHWTFFCDKADDDLGNDYTLAKRVEELGGTVHRVKCWQDTLEILKGLTNRG